MLSVTCLKCCALSGLGTSIFVFSAFQAIALLWVFQVKQSQVGDTLVGARSFLLQAIY